ncbi:MAG: CC0125/CC1285 family lipoprotein [Geminicoccaceae bacterium]
MVVLKSALRGRHLIGILLLVMLAACASPTPYQPATDGFGYADQQIESNRYRVSFAGNSVTPRQTVENYLLYRAAEVTLQTGHDYFTLVDQHIERSTSYQGTGFTDFPVVDRHGHSAFGFGTTSYTAYPIDRYTGYADVVVHDGEKPAGDVSAYDARDVVQRLGPAIARP